MREPVFNETVQLGIVVRDLEATVRRYVDDYGIGPWEFALIDAGDANNYREYGRPGDVGAYRAARRGRHLCPFPC
jgi:methylmalonyl-CoA/ethylmalonyl-CoA epimerase